jgi:hypothetical protein
VLEILSSEEERRSQQPQSILANNTIGVNVFAFVIFCFQVAVARALCMCLSGRFVNALHVRMCASCTVRLCAIAHEVWKTMCCSCCVLFCCNARSLLLLLVCRCANGG